MQQVNSHFFDLWKISNPSDIEENFVEDFGKVLSNPFSKLTRGKSNVKT